MARKHKVAEQTDCRWRQKFSAMDPAGIERLRELETESAKLERKLPLPLTGPSSVGACDFVHDACANGQQLECLTVIDEFTRKCPVIDVAGSIRSKRVVEALAKLVGERGAPRVLRSDYGPEFVSKTNFGNELVPFAAGKRYVI